jgi:hypothetical protein
MAVTFFRYLRLTIQICCYETEILPEDSGTCGGVSSEPGMVQLSKKHRPGSFCRRNSLLRKMQ